MLAQNLAIAGMAFVFITVGLANKVRGKGPWVTFLIGGVLMAVTEILSFLGWVTM